MTQRIALINETLSLDFLAGKLTEELPEADIVSWPDPRAQDAEVAVCWRPPAGYLASMPNLRLVHSIGAGVDGIMADPQLPDVPLCRIVDPALSDAIAEFVHWGVLQFHRRFNDVWRNAMARRWHRYEQKPASAVRVGLLGYGATGQTVAARLAAAGYPVSAWVRRPRAVSGVTLHAGADALSGFLAQTDVLVCLLPLTPETHGILNAELFARLPQGAGLILCSRGEHLDREAMVASLRAGHLRGAILDVFPTEPLPAEDPLWSEPGVLVTPHMAGLAKPRTIAEQIAGNIRALATGAPLVNKVDRTSGY